jgi:hypothetical protein
VADDGRYWASILQGQRPDLKLVNLACESHIARQEYLLAVMEVIYREPRPKTILLVDGWNDLALPALFGNRPGEPWKWERQRLMLSDSRWRNFKGFVGYHSNILRIWQRLFCAGVGVDYAEIEREYATWTGRLKALCAREGIVVLHVAQPCLPFRRTPVGLEKRHVTGEIARVIGDNYGALAGYAGLDLTGLFADERREVYADVCHLNELGQALFAEALAKVL